MSICRGEMEYISHGASLERRKHHAIYAFTHGCPPIFYCSPQTLPPEAPSTACDHLREPQLLMFNIVHCFHC